jgi:hypothetical protein
MGYIADEVVYSRTLVGGGTRSLPDNVHVTLELLDERRFGNGGVHLHYRAVPDTTSG